MEISDPEFRKLLLKLCSDYDCEMDNYPESMWQGEAVYLFYLEKYYPKLLDQYYDKCKDNLGLLNYREE